MCTEAAHLYSIVMLLARCCKIMDESTENAEKVSHPSKKPVKKNQCLEVGHTADNGYIQRDGDCKKASIKSIHA
jgi:hypothetical protein